MNHYKSNSHASTVSHTENCLIQLVDDIEQFGSAEQKALMAQAQDLLESLYHTLREEE